MIRALPLDLRRPGMEDTQHRTKQRGQMSWVLSRSPAAPR